MENRLSDKKAQGIPSYGTFTQLKSAAAIENIACAPFDFVVIDTEHQAIGTDRPRRAPVWRLWSASARYPDAQSCMRWTQAPPD